MRFLFAILPWEKKRDGFDKKIIHINNNSTYPMKEKIPKKKLQAEKREQAMIECIIEGSPDAVGVVVVRLECGCRKMAAPASRAAAITISRWAQCRYSSV